MVKREDLIIETSSSVLPPPLPPAAPKGEDTQYHYSPSTHCDLSLHINSWAS